MFITQLISYYFPVVSCCLCFLQTLYNLGSRKTAVFGITLLGCIPQGLSRYPRNIGSSGCVDFINNGVQLFNTRLISLIKDLNNNLPNARFTYLNITDISSGVPSATGRSTKY